MYLQPYQPHEIHWAYCYRLYLRTRTFRVLAVTPLARLDRPRLDLLVRPYSIRVLQAASNLTDLLGILSLRPAETISGCASKIKGQVSRWLGEELQLQQPENLLSKGYFACTVGKSNSNAVSRYLSSQAKHHGYDQRALPPVFVNEYQLSGSDELRLSAKHAAVVSRFHFVFSTFGRRGILGSREGQNIAAEWLRLQHKSRIALIKVSFVPDHVHLALRAHPSISPAQVACELMNSAQKTVQKEMMRAGLERLWIPSAYVGSYGNLAGAQLRKYIEDWQNEK